MQNTAKLKLFAQQTRIKLRDFVQAKLTYVLTADTAELRGKANQINKLRDEIKHKGEDGVVEEVAYTWFNRVMALRYMDANGYNTPMIVTPAEGQSRPEILQEALGGVVDDSLGLTPQEKLLPEEPLYRRLLVASCNQLSASMPFLFERISDYTELLLPDDLISANSFVTDIRNGMTDEDCQQLQIVGWLYQFYITDRKKDAEDKKSRKGGLKSDEQAAATQLFTPDWIVRYMVENTVGRIWMTLHPESPLRKEMKYYIDPADGQPDPIPEHIHSVKDITFLDPCMGSGHILIYAFILFAKMYEEEGYRPKDIPQLIIENNLYGMDIDRRCYQLASFAITMTACRYFGKRYLRHTVAPKVIALQPVPRDVIDATGPWENDSDMWHFEDLDTIGSLLKVTSEEYERIHVHEGVFASVECLMSEEAAFLARKYDCVVTNPPYLGKGMGEFVKNYCAKKYKIAKSDLYAAFILRCFDFTIENGFTGMVTMESWMFLSSFENLRKFIINEKQIRSLSHFDWNIMRIAFGTVSLILKNHLPDSFKGVYSYLDRNDIDYDNEIPYTFPNKGNGRYNIISQKEFLKMPGAPIGYWVTQADLIPFAKGVSLADVATPRQGMATSDVNRFIKFWPELNIKSIGFRIKNRAEAKDSHCKWFPHNKGGGIRKWYGNNYYVVNWANDGEEVLNFARKLYGSPTRTIKNINYYFQPSVTWGMIGGGLLSIRISDPGFLFDVGGPSAFEKDIPLTLIASFLNSKVAFFYIRIINPTLNFNSGDIGKLPFLKNKILEKGEIIIALTEKCELITRLDWDAHETSWDYGENPLVEIIGAVANGKGSIDIESEMRSQFNKATVSSCDGCHASLQQPCWDVIKPLYDEYNALVTSLQGLFHPAGGVPTHDGTLELCFKAFEKLWTARFMQLHANEEELNRQFINIYGLQDELTPDVPLNEITILQQGEITVDGDRIIWNDSVIVKQLVSYFVGCLMGRYSVDKKGLIIANQHQDIHALGLEVDGLEDSPKSTIAIDDDGIIPIIEEDSFFADDMANRISKAVEAVFGRVSYAENMRFIENALGKTLREYLFKDFYADHVQMYSVKGDRRPIYWLFSSRMGDKHKYGYFRALVYMHRMEADTLSQLHATYVAPYLKKAETQLREAENELTRDDLTGAQRNKANRIADELRSKVREVREFETKLVEMASHRTTFDLDDGVKANYPLFYPLVEPVKGLEKPKHKD